MEHIITKKFDPLNIILNRFFELNYFRNSIPEKFPQDDQELFEFACAIYKRGFFSSYSQALQNYSQCNLQILSETEFISFLREQNSRNTFFILDSYFLLHHENIDAILNPDNYYSYEPKEETKTLTTVKNILQFIPETTKSIFVLGGGITLDIGGFIAGLLNIPVDYLSTTLLSSIDAAIGGKTGVNFTPYGKNQIGLFYEARSLYFVPEYLKTLSEEQIFCGVVEAAKQAYLFGEFETDQFLLKKIISNCATEKEFIELVQKNFGYKSHIVKLDPKETYGLRSCLNLGHTFAHVLEGLAEQNKIEKISHGIAVAYGLKFLINNKLIETPQNFTHFIDAIVSKFPLIEKEKIDSAVLEKLIAQDKKNSQINTCSLTVPCYGFFSLKKNLIIEKNPQFKKDFEVQELAILMNNFIYD